MPVAKNELKPEAFYWARRAEHENAEIVQISTTFGAQPEFWAVAVMGSDERFDLERFEFLKRIEETS